MEKPTSVGGWIDSVVGRNLITIALFGLGFYFWGSIVEFLETTVLHSVNFVLYSIALCVLLAGVVAVVTSEELKIFMYSFWHKLTRGLLDAFIKADPIGMQKTILDEMQYKEIPSIEKERIESEGAADETAEQISKQADEAQTLSAKAQKAESVGDALNAQLWYENAGTLLKSNENLTPLLNALRDQSIYFKELEQTAKYVYGKMQFEYQTNKKEFEATTRGERALASGKKLMGNSKQKELFAQSSEEVTKRWHTYVASVRQLREESSKSFADMQYDRSANVDKAKALLQSYAQKQQALIQVVNQKQIAQTSTGSIPVPVFTAPEKVSVGVTKKKINL